MSKDQIATQRLYLSADKKVLVPEGHERAATLYATPGTTIPASACERFGLIDGALPEKKAPAKKAPAGKSKPAPGNKEQPAPENKGGEGAADKAEGAAQ